MSRLRYNGLATGASGSSVALALGASLTSSATSVTFNAALTFDNGTAVPTITGSDVIPLSILDANGMLSEVVWLTAYTTGGTTGTISRGQEGTTGIAHSSGAKIVAAPTALDLTAPQAQLLNYTAGDITLSAQTNGGTAATTAWVLLNSSVVIVFTSCVVGDILDVLASFAVSLSAGPTHVMDFVVWKNGALVRAAAAGGKYGDQALTIHPNDGTVVTKRGSSAIFVVASGDIHTDGTVTIGLAYQQLGTGSRVFNANADSPIRLQGIRHR
jgi:hypothetical protein